MIRITQLKLRPDHTHSDLEKAVRKALRLQPSVPVRWEILRQSIDARKKPNIFYVYTVDVKVPQEETILKNVRKDRNISRVSEEEYVFPVNNSTPDWNKRCRPVICGSGPAGMFCALMLARAGLCPVILERGESVGKRRKTVEKFWKTGELCTWSNVQFGEGGAGTFSDGKLNSMIKDRGGRVRFVLRTFAEHGADPSILYSYKPHVGTDVLYDVVSSIRGEIIRLGGEYRFGCTLTDIKKQADGSIRLTVTASDRLEGDKENADCTEEGPSAEHILTDTLVLAIGHSARDTFRMLSARHFKMTPKAFAIGVRIQHPQKLINDAMYGPDCPYEMPPSPYKLTHQTESGRGVYSFCMCPGGYVVNASSEKGELAVNGMSYHDRSGENANSAIVVTVDPSEYGNPDDPLSGIAFQRDLEKKAFRLKEGRIPVQRFEDFCMDRESLSLGSIRPAVRGQWALANVRSIFPEDISSAIEEGITAAERRIPGYSGPDVLLAGVESRTSSPVRITRGDDLQAAGFPGIYPCGEGAGYAGGITSAAVDGIRVAEQIIKNMNGFGS